MERDQSEDIDVVPCSKGLEDINVVRSGADRDILDEVTIIKETDIVDFQRLVELTDNSDKGSAQLAKLVKDWELQQANVVRLLKEELDQLSKQQQEELKKLEEHRFEKDRYGGDKHSIPILDENLSCFNQDALERGEGVVSQGEIAAIDAEHGSVVYWKQRALHLEKLLEASLRREQTLAEKLQESIEKLERKSSPVEELSQALRRENNFFHFVLQNAPVVIGHQDKELRYRFCFNHFPSLREQDVIGKTDVEIFCGGGIKESQDFKREVLERGLPAKREITFETELFGSKTFLMYVEPVFSKAGVTIGVNYMGMDVTDQVRKREKMARLREKIAVDKAKEMELNKTIHITEETMHAKQMLATFSHEIRSLLSSAVSMAEIVSTTNLDKEQRQLLKVMLSSADSVLHLTNDLFDLSKVESGAMKSEATKFRPREVVKHVLQTAAETSLLTLECHVAEDVPFEVIGDVIRIRQILTNLVRKAIKFTHQGKIGINLYVVPEPSNITEKGSNSRDQSTVSAHTRKDLPMPNSNESGLADDTASCQESQINNTPCDDPTDEDKGNRTDPSERLVWIRCDVYDTGIGIPEHAIPTLLEKYKQGGTGLGLAICKQLIELMRGYLTVSSVEHRGSTFTFVLPYKVLSTSDSDDTDQLTDSIAGS